MSDAPRKIHLCAFPHGGPLAWRHEDFHGEGELDFAMYRDMAQTLERGLFDAIFLADNLALNTWTAPLDLGDRIGNAVCFEPFTLLGALSQVTSHIGLMATASSTYNHPFHVARKFASLDHISGGRAGWNVVTSMTRREAANFGLVEQWTSEQRYARAEEFVDCVLGLWDSFDTGSFIRDRASGRYYDAATMRVLDHHGANFDIAGPLNLPRSPQGRPLVCQAGTSASGHALAARTADLVFVNGHTLEEGRTLYAATKARAAQFGRRPSDLLVIPGLFTVIGGSEEEAQRKLRDARDAVDMPTAKAFLNLFFPGIDLQDMQDDEPPVRSEGFLRAAAAAGIKLEEDGRALTVRELCTSHGNHWRHLQMVGSAEQVAADIARWLQQDAADGFNVFPHSLPGGFTDFVDGVVPELQRLGVYRTAYEGATVRDNFGLALPVRV